MRFHFLAFLILAAEAAASAQQQDVIRVSTNEVLVDAVVRDKKGRFLHKLEAGDFVLMEDGKPRKIIGFREVTGAGAPAALTASDAGGSASAPKTASSGRTVRVVSLVFDRLGPDGRKLARQGALELLNGAIEPNVYYGVFYIDHRLKLIQEFSNDRVKLRAAVERATGGTGSDYANDNASIKQAVTETSGSDGAAAGAALSQGKSVDGGGMANEQMNRMVQSMLDFSDMLSREQEGGSSIYALMATIQGQAKLPGRKAVVYFSEGIQLPNTLWTQFATLISTANKANVSVYAVDARGLRTASDMGSANAMLGSAVGASYTRWVHSVDTTPVTRSEAMVFDQGMDAIRGNVQAALGELAEGTGGALIANTNDLRTGLRKVNEEISSFYEISYQPENVAYDGRFHEISLKVNKPGAQVMSRSGYFSLPSIEGQIVYPYEVPLLNAFAKPPLPKAFDYGAAVVRFQPRAEGTQAALVFDVPMKDITFRKDESGKQYRTHVSVLALVKDGQGRVVAKLSRDVPVNEPTEKLEGFRNGRLIVTRVLRLQPGRYTVESAVTDREGEKISAKRAALAIPAVGAGVGLSGLTLIRRFDKAADDPEPDDPYVNGKTKIVPTLGARVPAGKGAMLSLYFLVYPQPGAGDRPKMTLEFLLDGVVVGQGSPELPQPDARGIIPYIANSSIETLKPGQYEVRVTVTQGGTSAQESTFITIE